MKLLADENIRGQILRGLLLRKPDLDIVRVQDVGLRTIEDPQVLEWAAQENRILLTYDIRTVPDFAYERVLQGKPMPGVIAISRTASTGQIIDDILTIVEASSEDEWKNLVFYIPF